MKRSRRNQIICAVVISTLVGMLGPTPTYAYERPGTTDLITVRVPSTPPNPPCAYPRSCAGALRSSLSSNGRFVAFQTADADLVKSDTNQEEDVFFHDRRTGMTKLVSVSSLGTQANHVLRVNPQRDSGSLDPSLSSNGRYVAFDSDAVNLVTGDSAPDRDVFVHDTKTGETTIVSVASGGRDTRAPGEDHDSSNAAISSSGRYVAFESYASDLVAGDTNEALDVFVHDRKTAKTKRLSVSSDGSQAAITTGIGSYGASISGNGRYVAFSSWAANLVEGDTNGAVDVFVHDLKTRSTKRVSVTSAGQQTTPQFFNETESSRALSENGRFVTFVSTAPNLVPNDAGVPNPFNNEADVFVHDRHTGRTEKVSVTSAGEEGEEDSELAAISGNGRWVTFRSMANNLAPGDTGRVGGPLFTNGDFDIFVYDRATGATEMISKDSEGAEASPCTDVLHPFPSPFQTSFGIPEISAGGQYVSFSSCSPNLDPADRGHTPTGWDLFVRDRGPVLGRVGALIAEAGSGAHEICVAGVCLPPLCVGDICLPPCVGDICPAPAVMARGGDSQSDLGPLLTSEGANLIGATLSYRPQSEDLFARVKLEEMPALTAPSVIGNASILYGLSFHVGGKSYEIRVQRLGNGSPRRAGTAAFGLFRCGGDVRECRKIATLRGGYGTMGFEIGVSLPLSRLHLPAGGRISDLEAFSALGSYELGAVKVLDSTDLRR